MRDKIEIEIFVEGSDQFRQKQTVDDRNNIFHYLGNENRKPPRKTSGENEIFFFSIETECSFTIKIPSHLFYLEMTAGNLCFGVVLCPYIPLFTSSLVWLKDEERWKRFPMVVAPYDCVFRVHSFPHIISHLSWRFDYSLHFTPEHQHPIMVENVVILLLLFHFLLSS